MKRRHSSASPEHLSNDDDADASQDFEDDLISSDDDIENETMSDDEVDVLLDEYLESKEKPQHIEKTKQVMKKRTQDYFEILPEGWIEVTHNSGMPLYLHLKSRVCTFSKPYYLGTDSVRKHKIPVSAIPCLQYRRDLEKEKEAERLDNGHEDDSMVDVVNTSSQPKGEANNECQMEISENNNVSVNEAASNANLSNNKDIQQLESSSLEQTDSNPNSAQSSNTNAAVDKNVPAEKQHKVETIQDHKRVNCLSPEEIKEYCIKLFEFEIIRIKKFKTWADRRKYNTMARAQRQRPFLPSDTRLITCPATGARKEFIMNPAGKSFVCILHEFVQHQEKVQPKYIYKELENANTPYSATVQIKDTTYGVGYGNSKRLAKSEAAKKTIEILIPEIKDFTEANTSLSGQVDSSKDLRFFDNIKIEDARVTELCAKAGQQSPYQILVECLKRNANTCDGELPITHHVQLIKPQKNVYTMTVNEHEVKVNCKNKREGKQKAAQAILQKLHPHVTSWGGLLLMYGRGSCKTPKEKKELELQITELQTAAVPNKPNHAILNKLREEMLKLPNNIE